MPYIFYDCDGTAVNSEKIAMPIASGFLVDVARQQGRNVSTETMNAMFGKTIADMVEVLRSDYGVCFQDNVVQLIHEETVRILSEKAQETPGMRDFLTYTQDLGYTNVIVTSSAHDRVFAAMKSAGIDSFFKEEHVFSAVSTLSPPEPKPSPAIYKYALNYFGIQPHETITFEDSLSGFQSAKRAEITCYGFLGGCHVKDKCEVHAQKLLDNGAAGIIMHWDEAKHLIAPQGFVINPQLAQKPRPEGIFP